MPRVAELRRRLLAEDGISVIEVLVVTFAMVAVTFGTLSAFDSFSSSAADTTRLADAQSAARQQLDGMTGVVRGAAPAAGSASAIVRPVVTGTTETSGTDLVVTTVDWPGNGGTSTAPRQVRYCVGANGAHTALWREVAEVGAAFAAACPAVRATADLLIERHVANAAGAPLFTVDGTRRSVGIDLRMTTGASRAGRVASLRSSAFLRSFAGRAPDLDPSAIDAACDPGGPDLLSLGVAGEGLDVVWSVITGSGTLQLGSGTSVRLDASSSKTVSATVTNALGLRQVLTRTVSCP